MEDFNPYKKILDEQIKKTGEINPVEEYNNLSKEERNINRNFWLHKKELPREIDEFIHTVNQKEDDLDFLEKKLKKIRSQEVKILRREARIEDIKKEIREYQNEFFPQDNKYEEIQSEILKLQNELELLESKVGDAKETISHFPEAIINYEQELDKDYRKMDLFDKQEKNKEQN